jgi:hypothetical protein
MHDKHAIVQRIVEADVVEVDLNQIIERHGASLMPRSPVHLVSLRSREDVDACLERWRLLSLRCTQRGEANRHEEQRSHVQSLPLLANQSGSFAASIWITA